MSQFQFKQFSITHGDCGMKVSTDGVLLGAWADPGEAASSLDIGTGTGLLSLMLAQRFSHLSITAVEYDTSAYRCACHNVLQSRFAHQICLRHDDIKAYQTAQQWPHIICNPPYFTSGAPSQNRQRAQARHTDTLTHPDLVTTLRRLLSPTGCADLILPIKEADALINTAHHYGLYLRRRVVVYPTPNKGPSRLLFTLSPTTGTLRSDTITVREQNGNYTQAFAALTRAFYLKLP
ncbi:tRNA1(Val) (adenine(37)-N6)-methyltransferase [Salinivibrio sp. ES.052]|uniref:tRNA1(Val) (adenine(37)-N6)-methyltransferase n=1 Tax=Salinivibrio sp. ES.052 TaxID=1882823 RepID=UPI00092A713B|nr:methyltransferase [Salinivibrio sp. ES.052]SIO42404.1 tRNA1Val (adenine37-N6)-methyltransferase [Salinivibrio sp. ES.052]